MRCNPSSVVAIVSASITFDSAVLTFGSAVVAFICTAVAFVSASNESAFTFSVNLPTNDELHLHLMYSVYL
jgi:hypothetical protein